MLDYKVHTYDDKDHFTGFCSPETMRVINKIFKL
ncbi:hypothetical protein SAMN05443253_104291 [Bacillus sp. OK048]|nr:hypothetical protein SAMN05443253_104291 [Bacillus sp. OK048]